MNLEYAQNTRKVGAGREKENHVKTSSCGLASVPGRRWYQEDTNTCSPAKRREFARRTAHFNCKEVYLYDQHNLRSTSNYTSGLKSRRIRFPLHLLDRSLVSTFCIYLPKMIFLNFLQDPVIVHHEEHQSDSCATPRHTGCY